MTVGSAMKAENALRVALAVASPEALAALIIGAADTDPEVEPITEHDADTGIAALASIAAEPLTPEEEAHLRDALRDVHLDRVTQVDESLTERRLLATLTAERNRYERLLAGQTAIRDQLLGHLRMQTLADEGLAAGGLTEWGGGLAETPAQWAYELALVISKARFGPGVDMGGKHNPNPSEQIAARRFVDAMYVALAKETP